MNPTGSAPASPQRGAALDLFQRAVVGLPALLGSLYFSDGFVGARYNPVTGALCAVLLLTGLVYLVRPIRSGEDLLQTLCRGVVAAAAFIAGFMTMDAGDLAGIPGGAFAGVFICAFGVFVLCYKNFQTVVAAMAVVTEDHKGLRRNDTSSSRFRHMELNPWMVLAVVIIACICVFYPPIRHRMGFYF